MTSNNFGVEYINSAWEIKRMVINKEVNTPEELAEKIININYAEYKKLDKELANINKKQRMGDEYIEKYELINCPVWVVRMFVKAFKIQLEEGFCDKIQIVEKLKDDD